MNKKPTWPLNKKALSKKEGKIEVKLPESPVERALKLSSNEVIATAIRDLMKRDELN